MQWCLFGKEIHDVHKNESSTICREPNKELRPRAPGSVCKLLSNASTGLYTDIPKSARPRLREAPLCPSGIVLRRRPIFNKTVRLMIGFLPVAQYMSMSWMT
eukprot:6486529-Amphidinium_carterae.3